MLSANPIGTGVGEAERETFETVHREQEERVDMRTVLITPRKYVQGRGVLKEIGTHAKTLGQTPLVLWDTVIKGIIGDTVRDSMKAAELPFADVEFQGESTKEEAARVAQIAKDNGADVMIGAGGGKVLDTAKAAAVQAGLKMITCPTISSNDSPTSAATVWYDKNGNFEGFECWPFNPDVVLVDSQVIANGPVRAFVAGMGDALATWVEAEAAYKTRALNLAGGRPTMAAMAIARLAYDNLMHYGVEAKRAVDKNLVTSQVERIIETNVLLSGLGFESGGLATAHMIGNLLSNYPESKNMMHGEKVSFGILTQLCLDEDVGVDEIYRIFDFLIAIGLPVTFSQLNHTEVSEAMLKEIGDICAGEGSLCGNHCFDVTSQDVVDAMLAADQLGQERLHKAAQS